MSWKGVKNQSLKSEIEAWCDEMGIKNYTINSQGEIDVKGNVNLTEKDFKELPFKFGIVKGYFDMDYCKNLISLKNSPNYVEGYFSCDFCKKLISLKKCPDRVGKYFSCGGCSQLDSLEGCPNMVEEKFWCD